MAAVVVVTAAAVAVAFTAVAVAFTAASRAEDSTAASQAVDFMAADFTTVDFHGFHHGFHRHVFVGLGFGPYYDEYYPYDYYDDGCYIVHRRVMTRYGWRIRPVQLCG